MSKVNRRAGWMDHALVQLTLVRFIEFTREPEALFWVFVFPILLAGGLGIAFRNRPAEVLKIGAVTPQLAQALRTEKLLDVEELPPAIAEKRAGPGTLAYLCTGTTCAAPMSGLAELEQALGR